MSKKRAIILGALALSVIVVYYSYKFLFNKQDMGGHHMPPVTVSALPVKSDSWRTKLQVTGTLNAINGVDVTTEIAGLVKTVLFDPGANVKKGEVLVELNADTEIAQLQALEAQAALAQINFDRDKKQYEVKAVSKATVDSDEADLKNKQALVAQQASIVAKKTIKAPFDGRLGISLIDLGQYLNPADKIVTLQSIDPIYINFNLPQQNLPQISVGQEVTLTTDTYPGEVFKGKITTINPKIDIQTRNVEVEATLPNPKAKLLPGMFGQIEIATGKPQNFLTLPQAAITYNPYGDLVYILKEKEKDAQGNPIYVANQKFVTLGEARGDQIQILTGLEAGDLIVTSGQMKLKNGSLAVVNNTDVPANNPNPVLENN